MNLERPRQVGRACSGQIHAQDSAIATTWEYGNRKVALKPKGELPMVIGRGRTARNSIDSCLNQKNLSNLIFGDG